MQSIKFSRNQLKMLAMLTMTLNHIVHVFEIPGIPGEFLTGIGYFTAPCMCYFLVEGFYHTRSVRKYGMRLFILGLLSQIPYDLAFSGAPFKTDQLNMMFNLFFCLCICVVYDKYKDGTNNRKRNLLLVILCLLCLVCDWNIIAPVMVLAILSKRAGRISELKATVIMAVVYMFFNYLNASDEAALFTGCGTHEPVTILYACLFLAFYLLGPCMLTWGLKHYDSTVSNHGPEWMKWFFYFYYPAHLLVLMGIRLLVM